MTCPEAVEFLYGLRFFGTKLGLENTHRFAELAGNPQRQLRFIHVAGTNGKGSTCAMLESIYRASGRRVGLFTSPHLVAFTERIQVNRAQIPREEVASLTLELCSLLGGPDREGWPFRPTFFEFVTVMALVYFARQKCELVIWETGLGGRLDATNIVTPLASVITNIQHDHEQWLGNSLAEIAQEKAGIIKPGIPAITGAREREALEVIERIAAESHAPLTVVREPANIPALSLHGEHQQFNAAVALATIAILQLDLPVAAEQIAFGLAHVYWPGRFQLVRKGKTEFLLDGAHNPDGARALAESLRRNFAGRNPALVIGIFKDKAWQDMLEALAPLASRILLVALESERSAAPDELATHCHTRWPDLPLVICPNVKAAIEHASANAFAVIAGSLHLIGEAMEILEISADSVSERRLNEWNAGNQ